MVKSKQFHGFRLMIVVAGLDSNCLLRAGIPGIFDR